jgi:hypothetical protein
MRLKQLLLLLPVFLFAALPAKADQDFVWVNGSYTSISNGFAIGPYGGTVTASGGSATPAQFFCVDFNHEIYGNTGWMANVTSLTSPSGYGQTFQGNQTFYLQAAWLITQMMNPENSKAMDAQLQWAIWFLSLTPTQQKNTSFPDYLTDLSWDQAALNAVTNPSGGFSVTGWKILTPTGGYGQEFILPGPGAATPEPSTLVLLFAGLTAFLVLARKR